MSPDTYQSLKRLLTLQEGYRQFPYEDTTGHLSIGVGRNLTDNGISYPEAQFLLENDLQYILDKLPARWSGFGLLSDNRQLVVANMCFNLGINGFLQFQALLGALEKEDYTAAGAEILNSQAARKLPTRYQTLAKIMETDSLNGII